MKELPTLFIHQSQVGLHYIIPDYYFSLDRKQRDHDLLKELEQFADKNTEHKKSTNKAPRISNIVEAAYIPPKTVYQDLRKLQGIQELSYIHTGNKIRLKSK